MASPRKGIPDRYVVGHKKGRGRVRGPGPPQREGWARNRKRRTRRTRRDHGDDEPSLNIIILSNLSRRRPLLQTCTVLYHGRPTLRRIHTSNPSRKGSTSSNSYFLPFKILIFQKSTQSAVFSPSASVWITRPFVFCLLTSMECFTCKSIDEDVLVRVSLEVRDAVLCKEEAGITLFLVSSGSCECLSED